MTSGSQYKHFLSRKKQLKGSSAKWEPFLPRPQCALPRVMANTLPVAVVTRSGIRPPCSSHSTNYKFRHDVFKLFNTLRPRQNGRHFADDTLKCIFANENVWIPIKISLKFVPKFPINNIPGLVQIMAWRRSGDKPLSEPMMDSLLTHICVARPHWVNNKNVFLYWTMIFKMAGEI